MENLMFSLNSTMPVFITMVVGYVLGRMGFLKKEWCAVTDKLVFKVCLPVMLFLDMSSIDMKSDFDAKYVLFCAGATTLAFFGIWGAARLLLKDKSLIAEFVQSSYRSSAAILGAAFITSIYGSSGMAPLMILGSVPLFNIYAVLVLTLENPSKKGGSLAADIKKALKNIVTNPIIDGIAAGALASLLGLHSYPVMLTKVLNNVAGLTSPLALLSIGAAFEGTKALKKLAPTLGASAIKLVVLEAIFLPLAVMLGFTDQKLVALIIMLGSPTTPTSYIMAKGMGHEGVLSSSCTAATTLLSAATLTFWIYLMRTLGYIA